MAVEGYEGWHGEGKTYCMVDDCLADYEGLLRRWEKAGRTSARPELWSNAQVLGARRFENWDDLMLLIERAIAERLRVICAVDEAGVWLPARFFNKMDPRVLQFLNERRKTGGGVDIRYSAPRISSVDKLLRDATQIAWKCKRYGGTEYSHDGGRRPWLFVATAFHPDELDKAKAKRRGRRLHAFSRDVAGAYATGLVELRKPMEGVVMAARPDYQSAADRHGDGDRRVDLAIRVESDKGGRGRKRK
ncbi:MAG TPA: hypothetical protein VHZ31_08865 [Solirubrobacteraceae bacterium]|jgi:hypothetical protein|nr:hypothetical protein [Solirubrobacteraceae bacterium]